MTDPVGPEHPERVFHRYGGWPLVPADDLLKLRQSLRQVQNADAPNASTELLSLVDHEVHRRRFAAQGGRPSGHHAGTD